MLLLKLTRSTATKTVVDETLAHGRGSFEGITKFLKDNEKKRGVAVKTRTNALADGKRAHQARVRKVLFDWAM